MAWRCRVGMVAVVAGLLATTGVKVAAACNEPQLKQGSSVTPRTVRPGDTITVTINDVSSGAYWELKTPWETRSGVRSGSSGSVSEQFTVPEGSGRIEVTASVDQAHHEEYEGQGDGGWPVSSDDIIEYAAPPAPAQEPAPPPASEPPAQDAAPVGRQQPAPAPVAPERRSAAGGVTVIETTVAIVPRPRANRPATATTPVAPAVPRPAERVLVQPAPDVAKPAARRLAPPRVRPREAAVLVPRLRRLAESAARGVETKLISVGRPVPADGPPAVVLVVGALVALSLVAVIAVGRRPGRGGGVGAPTASDPPPHDLVVEAELQEIVAEGRAARLARERYETGPGSLPELEDSS